MHKEKQTPCDRRRAAFPLCAFWRLLLPPSNRTRSNRIKPDSTGSNRRPCKSRGPSATHGNMDCGGKGVTGARHRFGPEVSRPSACFFPTKAASSFASTPRTLPPQSKFPLNLQSNPIQPNQTASNPRSGCQGGRPPGSPPRRLAPSPSPRFPVPWQGRNQMAPGPHFGPPGAILSPHATKLLLTCYTHESPKCHPATTPFPGAKKVPFLTLSSLVDAAFFEKVSAIVLPGWWRLASVGAEGSPRCGDRPSPK